MKKWRLDRRDEGLYLGKILSLDLTYERVLASFTTRSWIAAYFLSLFQIFLHEEKILESNLNSRIDRNRLDHLCYDVRKVWYNLQMNPVTKYSNPARRYPTFVSCSFHITLLNIFFFEKLFIVSKVCWFISFSKNEQYLHTMYLIESILTHHNIKCNILKTIDQQRSKQLTLVASNENSISFFERLWVCWWNRIVRSNRSSCLNI